MATALKVEERLAPAEQSQLRVTWTRFRKHRLGLIGLFTLITLVLLVIVIPMISPFKFDDINDATPFTPAMSHAFDGRTYILGTDDVGRDNFTRLFYAGRISLTVGLLSTILVVLIGSTIGSTLS
jgi:ABC-type dipeptide/oligopeptide/nickel transport system permease subunit